MKKRVPLTLITFAFMLACGAAFAEESPGIRSHDGHRGHASMMGCGMMGRGGMMGSSGMMRQGAAMRIIFALMDGDGDGTVSLQEFQAANEKIFKAMGYATGARKPAAGNKRLRRKVGRSAGR